MDYMILHSVNGFVVAHPMLASAVQLFASWIVPLVVAATVIPWLASGRGIDARKRATAGALAHGYPVPDAVAFAKQWVTECIRAAYPLGHGHGPVSPLFRLNRLSDES